jgi:CheY-like chemotaxis protein/HPt (histidine-containing phosphotransfer) domain-containing protein
MQVFEKTPTRHSAAMPVTNPRSTSFVLRGRKALLVEDNAINQLVAMEMLEGLGLQVQVADDGDEAVNIVKAGSFDVVMMDIQMPGMDGYQATAQIRSDPRFQFTKLPIIAMTAHALVGDREKILESGFNDYVSKPVDLHQLSSALLRWLEPHADATHPVSAPSLPAAKQILNMKSAIERLGSNQQLYERLLVLFGETHRNGVAGIRVALQQQNMELALRLTHTIKGVAGTIGADRLAGLAKQLENTLKEQDAARYSVCLQELEDEMTLVLAVTETSADLGNAAGWLE